MSKLKATAEAGNEQKNIFHDGAKNCERNPLVLRQFTMCLHGAQIKKATTEVVAFIKHSWCASI
ncbi:MAG: hypothetical protein EBU66_11270 [Bacteroidetes bacterium]|nr:hypothetical protein [bacterium]NBP65220.1 hypothetical protein [Bacteroidota bacterium]